MMKVHTDGRGVAGIYTYDIAVTKKKKTESEAARNGFPLKCTLEKE
jgi:ATP-dependent Clp protease adaptor protein ClpS